MFEDIDHCILDVTLWRTVQFRTIARTLKYCKLNLLTIKEINLNISYASNLLKVTEVGFHVHIFCLRKDINYYEKIVFTIETIIQPNCYVRIV